MREKRSPDIRSKMIRLKNINFLATQESIKFKQAMGREKDFKDIALIEEYLKNSKN